MSRSIVTWTAIALACLSPPTIETARAHVVARPDSGTAGSSIETEFNVSHGCEGSATISIAMKIPEGVLFVKPKFKPGWTVVIKKRKLPEAVPALHGKTVAETVDEIVWSGGPLPNDLYDTFAVRMRLPNTPGQTVYFPIVQQCRKGVHRWIEIPPEGKGWGDMHAPPPFVKIVPKAP